MFKIFLKIHGYKEHFKFYFHKEILICIYSDQNEKSFYKPLSSQIWLKDAVQCRQCGMCCHKKCVAKCQNSNGCNPDKTMSVKSEVSLSDVILQPDNVAEEMENGCGNLKRVNSVTNLTIPGA